MQFKFSCLKKRWCEVLRSNLTVRYDPVSIIFYFRQGRKKLSLAIACYYWSSIDRHVACIVSCVCCVPTWKMRIAKVMNELQHQVRFHFYFVLLSEDCCETNGWETARESGSKGGSLVRALASHQCSPVSNPLVRRHSFLLVLSLALRGFSPDAPVFPSTQKPEFFQIPIRSEPHEHV